MKMGVTLIVVGLVITAIGAVITFRDSDKAKEETVYIGPRVDKPAEDSVRNQEPAPSQVGTRYIASKPEQQKNTASEMVQEKPEQDPKAKGNDFEGHFADILKVSSCRLLEWNQGATSPEGAYAENELNPDFLVSQKARGKDIVYWVECKYRSSLPSEGFTLKSYQLERYSKIQGKSKRKILLAVGVGGRPASPEKVYIIPLDSLVRFKRVGHKYLPGYLLENPRQNFSEHMESWFFDEVFTKKSR